MTRGFRSITVIRSTDCSWPRHGTRPWRSSRATRPWKPTACPSS